MKKNRVYGNIQTVSDLQLLQMEAEKHGLVAVGILDSGAMHKMAGFGTQPVTKEEAVKLLNVTSDQLNEIIKFKGKFEIEDPTEFNEDLLIDDTVVEDLPLEEDDEIVEEVVEDELSEKEIIEEVVEPEEIIKEELLSDDVILSKEEFESLKLKAESFDYLVENLNSTDKEVAASNVKVVSNEEFDDLVNRQLKPGEIAITQEAHDALIKDHVELKEIKVILQDLNILS